MAAAATLRAVRWLFLVWLIAWAAAATASAQSVTRTVVDQVGLALPGVQVTLIRGEVIVSVTISAADGAFELPAIEPDDIVEAALPAFDTIRVAAASTAPIVLRLARVTARADVTAPSVVAGGEATEHLGGTMTSSAAGLLPSVRRTIVAALPLLPSVLRGPDGLLRIGGTKPGSTLPAGPS